MAATIKTIQRPDKRRDDGTCPIYIRATVSRKTALIATKIYVPSRDWNAKKGRVRAGHDLADAYNARIDNLEREALELGLDAVSAAEVKKKLLKGTGQVQQDVRDYITELSERDQEWERKKFMVLAGKLEACFGSALTWEQLDSAALVKFEKHLRGKLGNSSNTIRSEMKRLRRLFKRALKLRTVRADQDPFLAYTRPKQTSTDRRKLTLEEMKALEVLDLPTGSGLERARDAFLFSFYGGGVRFGDLCNLRPENIVDGRLTYRMLKTNSSVSLKLPQEALQLADRYSKGDRTMLFPFVKDSDTTDATHFRRRVSSANVIANRNLKKLAELAEIPPDGLSMHVARHSFADYARTSDGDLYAISKALGHGDLKTTETYLKSFDQDAVDELSDSLWGEVQPAS